MPCEECGDQPYHFVARAHATRRWRGKSFDADQAMGNLGLALMDALGLATHEFQRFSDLVRITPYRESADLNPPTEIPAEGESWEFHVAVLQDVGAESVEGLKKAAVHALDQTQGFDSAEIQA